MIQILFVASEENFSGSREVKVSFVGLPMTFLFLRHIVSEESKKSKLASSLPLYAVLS